MDNGGTERLREITKIRLSGGGDDFGSQVTETME